MIAFFCKVEYKPSYHCIADIAQLVELLICNQWVGSSSLSVGTIQNPGFPGIFYNFERGKILLKTAEFLRF